MKESVPDPGLEARKVDPFQLKGEGTVNVGDEALKGPSSPPEQVLRYSPATKEADDPTRKVALPGSMAP
ncbi:MAG: hypothetical protein OXU26_00270 [Acidobacteriota bacterium]|nr:hypothetical protein [Acidobacteriota bacterium]